MTTWHPSAILGEEEEASFPDIPCVEHYASSLPTLAKALSPGFAGVESRLFDVTCDLEDGVALGVGAGYLEDAAEIILGAAATGPRIGVRIAGVGTPGWEEQVDDVIGSFGKRLAYGNGPKIESTRELGTLAKRMEKACARAGLAPIPLHVLVESPRSIRNVESLAAFPGVESLSFGIADYVHSCGGIIPLSNLNGEAQFSHPLLIASKARLVSAAVANRRVPSHNTCFQLDDPALVRRQAERARGEGGFLRMISIHPSHIGPIVEGLSPSFDELSDAASILLEAQAKDWAGIRYRGMFHDRATYRYHWDLLLRARRLGRGLPLEAERRFFENS